MNEAEVERTFQSILALHAHSAGVGQQLIRTLNDAGNADRLVGLLAGRLLWNRDRRSWMAWDDRRWRLDRGGEAAMRCATEVQRLIHEQAAEALAQGDGETYKRVANWALRSGDARRLEAMLKVARAQLAVGTDKLDPTDLFNTTSGTLDLNTLELRAWTPEDRITRIAGCGYVPSAECDHWKSFLKFVLPSPAMRTFFRRAVGYSLLGDQREKALFVIHGPKNSGKSTALNALRRMFGDRDQEGYAATADIATFSASRVTEERNTPGLARLPGVRLVIVNEVPAGRLLAAPLIKAFTGGDQLQAAAKYGHPFTFQPRGTLWFVGNDPPELPYTDDAAWVRVYVLPFSRSVPEQRQDKGLLEKIDPEGVLAWAVQGLRDYRRKGELAPPRASRIAKTRQRAESNPIADYLEEKCELGEGFEISIADLFADYQYWSSGRREPSPLNKTAFGACVKKQRGVSKRRAAKGRWMWTGIRLRPV